jgi:S1-C subfamily serine protease
MKHKAWLVLGIILVSLLFLHTHPQQIADWSRPLPVSTIENLGEYVQSTSVTVVTPDGEGSASLFEREIDGAIYQFAWTAAHVVYDMRTRKVTKHVILTRHHYSNGRQSGITIHKARVIAWSDPETGYDLALLLVEGRFTLSHGGVHFNIKKKFPSLGMEVFHVGSFFGEIGHNSFSVGIISHVGRVLPGLPHEYDQTTAPVYPGSSGGGVFDREGMVVRRADSTFNFIVPMRLMLIWANKEGLLWALDPSVKLPSIEELLEREVGLQNTNPAKQVPQNEPPQPESENEPEQGELAANVQP